MPDLQQYLDKRGITADDMAVARRDTQASLQAFTLREARRACHLTQMELAQRVGVSQNRISRMENGNPGAMSTDVLRRYVEALGGTLTLVADLPVDRVELK